MIHVLTFYNEQLALLKEAMNELLKLKNLQHRDIAEASLKRLPEKGGKPILFLTEEIQQMFSAMSVLEFKKGYGVVSSTAASSLRTVLRQELGLTGWGN